MKLLSLCSLCILLAFNAPAQFSIRLVVTDVATRQSDDVYVSGTFNNWIPNDEKFKLKPFGGSRKSIVIKNIAQGNYAFKFTRGSFSKVECMADGRDISDRIVDVSADVSLECSIAGWKDDYPEKPKRYTASPQVKIIDTAFAMPQLGRKRRIWVYLPKDYATSTKTYPVLYMNDGQNLFNEQTAAFGKEWGVDECLDTLQKKVDAGCIVVGIDNGGDTRLKEYSPFDFSEKGGLAPPDTKGEGTLYADFIVKTLKPFIDGKYRTKKGRDFTSIAGSSMGGLISTYVALQFPDVFGSAGVFSPAYWISPNLYALAEKANTENKIRIYFYAGGKESKTMVSDMERLYNLVVKKERFDVVKKINQLGEHSEAFWQQEFPNFYLWLMKKDQ